MGPQRYRYSVDSRTTTTATPSTATQRFQKRGVANPSGGQTSPTMSPPPLPATQEETDEVDDQVHFTFSASAMASMRRKSEADVDEDKQNM